MKRTRIKIFGKVQDIGFRWFIYTNAKKLNVNGWVRNIDNDVEAVFEGLDKQVNELTKLCKKGPDPAIIDHVKVIEEPCKNEFNNFKII